MPEQLRKQWFLIGLLSALAGGYLLQQPLTAIADATWLRSTLVASVLFMMGLAFSMQSLVDSIRQPKAAMLAFSLNVVAVPLAAASVAWVLPTALSGGLIVAAAVPCTLASASIWVRRAGGDDTVSMLVTVSTNLLCFIIAPTTLLLLIGQRVELDFMQQVTKLALLVVVPLSLAQLLRQSQSIAAVVDRHRPKISIASQCGILMMVTLGTVATSRKLAANESAPSLPDTLLMIAMAIAVHCVVLIAGWLLARTLGLRRPQQVAVAIAGSQKTLMVGLQIAVDCGVSMMPMIAYHISQLVIDTIIVDRWADSDDELS